MGINPAFTEKVIYFPSFYLLSYLINTLKNRGNSKKFHKKVSTFLEYDLT